MITREELKQFASSHSWYQTIQFEDDVLAKGPPWCGEPAWGNIIKFLPPSLKGMRILDLGCNAGLFCVKSVLMGAKEVVGIDYPPWRPKWDFREQRVFVKKYFEQKHNRVFPITYIEGKMSEVLATQDLGKFDYLLAIASIYYTFDHQKAVDGICKVTDRVVLRLRDDNRVKQYTTLFRRAGYTERKVLREKWWERLGHQTDDFYLFLYVREGVDV